MDAAGLQSVYLALERYAGWLDRDRTSAMVRADVKALGAAIDSGADASPFLQSLDANIARLPGGGMRKMLRVAAGQLRSALSAS